MSQCPLPAEMARTYDAQAIEQPLYAWWEQQGYFRPDQSLEKEPFVISMPPPNVTGALHLGHAITASVEDALIRYHRTERAPDAVGARLRPRRHRHAERGRARAGQGRADAATTWAAKSSSSASGSGKRSITTASPTSTGGWASPATGSASALPWTRGLSRAVREAFVRLYEQGLDLPRRLPGQLVPALRHGHLGPGGGARGRGLAPLVRALLDGGWQRARSPWPRRGPRRSWATPRWPCIRTTSAIATWWA